MKEHRSLLFKIAFVHPTGLELFAFQEAFIEAAHSRFGVGIFVEDFSVAEQARISLGFELRKELVLQALFLGLKRRVRGQIPDAIGILLEVVELFGPTFAEAKSPVSIGGIFPVSLEDLGL